MPQSMRLEPNYPNPVNSGTEIPFALALPAQVELTIYNVAGQKVRTLLHGTRGAGNHQVRWDGRGESGRELSSGVYLYRLRAGAGVQTRKLLLLR